MGECSDSVKQKPHLLVLLYLSVGLGALISSLLTINFAYQWFNVMNVSNRRKLMPRLCFFLQICLAIERFFRTAEIYFWFHGSHMATDICYHLNNTLFLYVGVYGALMALLIIRIRTTFDGSVYAMSVRKIRALFALIIVCIISQSIFTALNGIRPVINNRIGRFIIIAGASFSFILNVTILMKLDISFGSRLKELVSTSAALNPNFSNMNTTPVSFSTKKRTSQLSQLEIVNNDSSGSNSDSDSVIIKKQSSFAAIRNASVSSYDPNHQQLLLAASKSMVLAMMISLSFLCFTIAAILFIYGSCQDIPTILGHTMMIITYVILSLSITLTMPHSHSSYQFYCSKIDHMIQKFVAFQTDNEVVEIRQKSLQQIPDNEAIDC